MTSSTVTAAGARGRAPANASDVQIADGTVLGARRAVSRGSSHPGGTVQGSALACGS